MKLMNTLCSKVACFFVTREKKEAGSHLFEILGTILVALILLVIFRDELQTIFRDVMKKVSDAVTALFNGGKPTTPNT